MTYTLILLFCIATGECREVPQPGLWTLKDCMKRGQESAHAHAWKCRTAARNEEAT